MRKFEFRLEKLLEYRRILEEAAKKSAMAATARRIQGEADVDEVRDRRGTALGLRLESLDERRQLERYLEKLDDDERAGLAAVSVLLAEEENAQRLWMKAKQDVDAVEKLREKALEEWKLEESRAEQRELDEWAVTRRVA